LDLDPDAYTANTIIGKHLVHVELSPRIFQQNSFLEKLNMSPPTKAITVSSSNWIQVFPLMLSDDIKSVLKTLTAEV